MPFVLLLMVNLINGCTHDVNQFSLGIDVQASFNQDDVKILVDGQERINMTLQTSNLLGVCSGVGQIKFAVEGGVHKIEVIVNNSVVKAENFSMDKNLYIGVNYNPLVKEISLIYSNTPFGYD